MLWKVPWVPGVTGVTGLSVPRAVVEELRHGGTVGITLRRESVTQTLALSQVTFYYWQEILETDKLQVLAVVGC